MDLNKLRMEHANHKNLTCRLFTHGDSSYCTCGASEHNTFVDQAIAEQRRLVEAIRDYLVCSNVGNLDNLLRALSVFETGVDHE